MKNYVGNILKLLSILLLFGIIYHQKEELKELRHSEIDHTKRAVTSQALIDSLQNELFIQHTIVDRCDIALEGLRETNPTAAEQFEELYRQSE